ncbi:hypothetical protein BGX34_008503 [Mortierella sp. NVP85]|nr:hypothetical protein BGX34_008503 [Mortierella sp. NVP85]
MAVASIYILDFAINCVQASCRTLIVDSLPSSQQEAAASWASRLMGIGGILGYFMGNVNLPERIPAFGDTQIKGLCIIACLFLVLAVGLTCLSVTERVMVRAATSSTSSVDEFLQGFRTVFRAIRHLPTRIQYLCNVQFFSWMGWFPFLFYSSTYIAEIYTQEQAGKGAPVNNDDTTDQAGVQDAAVRAGSFCLLIYSIVSLFASVLLPAFVAPAEQFSSGSSGPFSNTRSRSESDGGTPKRPSVWYKLRPPRWMRLPIQGLTLPKMFTLSLFLVSFSLVSTWYVHDLRGSTILFAFCGVSWAVSMWAPFSILGEVISQQMQEEQHQERIRVSTSSSHAESTTVLFQKGEDDDESETEEIQMTESSHGRQYRPLKARESLDEVVTITESKYKSSRPGMSNISSSESFRSRTGTPSPTVANGKSANDSSIERGPPSDQNITQMDSDVDTDRTNSDHCESEDDSPGLRKGRSSEERGLVQKRDGSSRSFKPSRARSAKSSRSQSHSHSRGRHEQSLNSGHSSLHSDTRNSTAQPTRSHSTESASSAGALLGIHNIYIVLPQFLVSFLSSLVFAAIEPHPSGSGDSDASDQPGNPETIGVMLRIGGIMAGIAALLSLKLWQQPRSVVPMNQDM